MIPESFIQHLLEKVDLIDIIERYLPLKKRGNNYFACCPFHNEKSPSFSVNPSKQYYHCFGCGAGGNAISFLMNYSGLTFTDAVKELAHICNLTVPETLTHIDTQQVKQRDQLLSIMNQAALFYQRQLQHSSKALQYLQQRDINQETIKQFGIGYAPTSFEGLKQCFPNYEDSNLVTAGLVSVNEQNRRYDRFRNRIIFPIHNARGQIIAFGGRVIDKEDAPKYLNSPETPLFEKSNELYRLDLSARNIRQNDYVLLVEGYMDVVSLAQHGFQNALASLGTATNTKHIKALLRHTHNIVFAFDGDSAGQKAAWKALENTLDLIEDDIQIRFLFLPPEHDPDSFIRHHGKEQFQEAIHQAQALSHFFINTLKSQCNLDTAEGRTHLLFLAQPYIKRLKLPLLRLQLIKSLAQLSGLTQQEIEQSYGLPISFTTHSHNARNSINRNNRYRTNLNTSTRKKITSVEETLLSLVLQYPEFAKNIPIHLLEQQTHPYEPLIAVIDALDTGNLLPNFSSVQILELFRNSPHFPIINTLLGAQFEHSTQEDVATQLFQDCLEKCQTNAYAYEISLLTEKAKQHPLDQTDKQRLNELLQGKQKRF